MTMILLASIGAPDLIPFIAVGLIAFFVGLGMVINGLVFTVPRKTLADRSDEAKSQMELETKIQKATPNRLRFWFSNNKRPAGRNRIARHPSVTEHTTHQLKPNNS